MLSYETQAKKSLGRYCSGVFLNIWSCWFKSNELSHTPGKGVGPAMGLLEFVPAILLAQFWEPLCWAFLLKKKKVKAFTSPIPSCLGPSPILPSRYPGISSSNLNSQMLAGSATYCQPVPFWCSLLLWYHKCALWHVYYTKCWCWRIASGLKLDRTWLLVWAKSVRLSSPIFSTSQDFSWFCCLNRYITYSWDRL